MCIYGILSIVIPVNVFFYKVSNTTTNNTTINTFSIYSIKLIPHDYDDDTSFFDKFELLHKSVYSSDEKKLGFVKKVLPDNMVIQSEFTWLRKYIVSKSSIASISKKDIKLKITAYEVRHTYSYPKMKNILTPLKTITKASNTTVTTKVKRIFLELHESIQYSRWQRNQLAAAVAFVSGIMFLISGYKVDLTFYYLIQKEILFNIPSNLWSLVIVSKGFS